MKKINIAELLKDCPKGMELDCTMFEGLEFDGIVDNEFFPIRCCVKHSDGGYNVYNFTKYGCWLDTTSAKCVIFPKGKTTWEGFVPPCKFKDGDILVDNIFPFIYKDCDKTEMVKSYCGIDTKGNFWKASNRWTTLDKITFATEEQKEKLFKAIKDNGYKWNQETKTLEKLSKFKVGDIVHNINNINSKLKIIGIADNYYICENDFRIYFKYQENWEIHREFNWEEIEKINNKFDITTLIPFESKVLIRNDENQIWIPAFWGYKVVDGFITTFGWCKYCIPYNGNENLFKTNNDCNSFYKTWINE